MPVRTVWRWIAGFGRFWYGFIIGDDWVAAAGVLVMLGAAYGLLRLHVLAWWAGPVVITSTLLTTLRRAERRERARRNAAAAKGTTPRQEPGTGRGQGFVDITELILADHHEQRRMFAILDEVGNDPGRLEPIWTRLAILLEVHADAEEELFYPRLLAVGKGGDDGENATEETKDAIHDHDEIRDGIRRAGQHPVGSDAWWQAVDDTQIANSDHMAEEERQGLADFRRHASLQDRHELGVQFAVFEAAHASGIPLQDKDPDRYVREHARPGAGLKRLRSQTRNAAFRASAVRILPF
jgi:hypothetical protein